MTKKKETVSEVKETVRISKRTGKPVRKANGANSPVIGMNGYNLKPGDNTQIIALNMELFNLPFINMRDPEQVQNRLGEYFQIYSKYDMKPTVAGMAMSMNGMSRRTLWGIVNDAGTGGDGYKSALPSEVTLVIKKAYRFMETSWESYMNMGKLNPVTGIFLAKNNFGYKDQTETIVTPNVNHDNDYNADEIRKRYIDSKE